MPFVVVVTLIFPFVYLFTGKPFDIFNILDKYETLIEYFAKKR